jgi:hypothetical protein
VITSRQRLHPRLSSLAGSQRSQSVATGCKCEGAENGADNRKPLPWVATGCRRDSMVSRASAVGCHPLREVPSLRRRGSMSVRDLRRDYFLLQSGQGHWSQPQPVHASRITRRILSVSSEDDRPLTRIPRSERLRDGGRFVARARRQARTSARRSLLARQRRERQQ